MFNDLSERATNAFNAIGGAIDWLDGVWDRFHASVNDAVSAIARTLAAWSDEFFSKTVALGKNIIDGLVAGIKASPGAVWEALKGVVMAGVANTRAMLGIKSPSRVFMAMGGHITDGLAIGITQGKPTVIAALDDLTKSIKKSFEGMIDGKAIDIWQRAKLRLNMAGIFGGEKVNPFGSLGGDAQAAVSAASSKFKLGQAGIFGKSANDNFFGAMDALDPAVQARFKAATTLMAVQMGVLGSVNVKVQKSFKDLADGTLGAIDKMVGAFKGGGFLDILGAVIGLGLQLGSVGVFGKGFQTRVNSIPAHAAGTNFAPGGLSLVGERGPELVNLPRGAGVIPNHKLGGMGGGGNTYHFQGNLMTPEFWQMINAGDQQAAMAGAMGGQRRTAFQQSRRVA